jgi:Vitamin K-dependent gamma-carboxylase
MDRKMIKQIPELFTRDFEHWFKIEIFRRVLYIFLLINTVTLLPIASDLWSYHGMSGTRWDYSLPIWKQVSTSFLNVLSHPANATYTWVYIVFIVGQISFLVLGIFRILPKISALAVYFFTVNLNMKGALMFTGGEVLLNLMLFYLIFIQSSDNSQKWKARFWINRNEKPAFSALQNAMNNSFYWIILIQVCILYFFSTLYKLLDENWRSGDAIMYISNVSAYSSGAMRAVFSESHFLSVIASYAILIYQGFFPILVWIKKIKIPFLLFGVFFHLSIAFGMGIFTFGIVMCLVYLPFLSSDQIDKLRNKLMFFEKKK